MGATNPVVFVGFSGRMTSLLREICEEQKIDYKILSSKAPEKQRVRDLKGSSGAIDFSHPSFTPTLCKLAMEAHVPLVSGTTGFSTPLENVFEKAAQQIPVLWDSNFSLGIEVLCQLAELAALKLKWPVSVLDIHHEHKKDSPSGTALKLSHRIHGQGAETPVSFHSIRLGEIPGEHRILMNFCHETLELSHRVTSRRPFAEGALKALNWLQHQQKGLYGMKDML